MPTDSDPQMNEEPLLGPAPALGDEAWDGMLDEAFLAPPGLADHLVDSFDEHGAADHELDADAIDPDAVEADHAFDAAMFGGEGAAGGEEIDDDALDDADGAEDETAPAAAESDDAGHAADDLDLNALDLDGIPALDGDPVDFDAGLAESGLDDTGLDGADLHDGDHGLADFFG